MLLEFHFPKHPPCNCENNIKTNVTLFWAFKKFFKASLILDLERLFLTLSIELHSLFRQNEL